VKRLARCVAVAALLLGPARAAPLPHDVYIWQRVWTPALTSALGRAQVFASGFRVLAGESDAPGRFVAIAPDWEALTRTHRALEIVVRIDGQVALDRNTVLFSQIGAVAKSWRDHGLAPVGLEIDYDCATAKLDSYAAFLAMLRRRPGLPHRLSVTALPAWLGSSSFATVFGATDEVVLQVHAVRAPQSGLFDAQRARNWIDALDTEDAKPFRVALPDYGTRIVRDEAGRVVAVESEMPRLVGGASAAELIAAPADVAALLRDLGRRPPVHLAGFVWFRLPADGDRRIWSLDTLSAVIHGAPLSPALAVAAHPSTTPGMQDVFLVNSGDTDAPLPAWIDLAPGCRLADGVNGYALVNSSTRLSLARLQTGLLPAHTRQVVGWMRCDVGGIHVRS
jgi:hypothetical protein